MRDLILYRYLVILFIIMNDVLCLLLLKSIEKFQCLRYRDEFSAYLLHSIRVMLIIKTL
jgi:hypothetical protein